MFSLPVGFKVDMAPWARSLLSVFTQSSASALDFARRVYTLELNSNANNPTNIMNVVVLEGYR